jgi:hypothetical protein
MNFIVNCQLPPLSNATSCPGSSGGNPIGDYTNLYLILELVSKPNNNSDIARFRVRETVYSVVYYINFMILTYNITHE